jgi:protein-S-isoprenylcysteine O-methyltransferase Ste14
LEIKSAMNILESKVPPPIVMLAFAGIMKLAASFTPFLSLPGGLLAAVAVVIAGAGVLIMLAGVVSFARARTSIDPTHPRSATVFVSSGIYRFTRNPMYLGDLLLLVAWAVYLSNPLALLIIPVFVGYINRFQIRAEERALLDLFGETYTAYQSRVRRWL